MTTSYTRVDLASRQPSAERPKSFYLLDQLERICSIASNQAWTFAIGKRQREFSAPKRSHLHTNSTMYPTYSSTYPPIPILRNAVQERYPNKMGTPGDSRPENQEASNSAKNQLGTWNPTAELGPLARARIAIPSFPPTWRRGLITRTEKKYSYPSTARLPIYTTLIATMSMSMPMSLPTPLPLHSVLMLTWRSK